MKSPQHRALEIQQRAERAVAYWIERLADNNLPFVGSDDEERFLPLSALLADLLERGTSSDAAGGELDRADVLTNQIEAYSMGAEGMRIRARAAYEDMMTRREEPGAPLSQFRDLHERLMTLLHAVDTNRAEDLGAALLEARRMLLEMEDMALA
jgi:hypothetical protein